MVLVVITLLFGMLKPVSKLLPSLKRPKTTGKAKSPNLDVIPPFLT